MRAIFFSAVYTPLLFVSWQKSVAQENPLVGKWLWRKSTGGITGNDLRTPLPGTFKVLWINNESEYIMDQGQDNYIRMQYTVSPANDISTGQPVKGITFHNELNAPGIMQHFIKQGDQLVITDNITGAYRRFYW